MFSATIISAMPVCRYRLGSYEAHLLANVVARGSVRYTFVLEVISLDRLEYCYVTLETNILARPDIRAHLGLTMDQDVETHFLGIIDQSGHSNLGPTSALADITAFSAKALALLENRLGCEAVLIPSFGP